MGLVAAQRKSTPASRAMGTKLRDLRVRSKKTQRQLAEILGISHKTVSSYEVGNAILGPKKYAEWAPALGVSEAELTSALGYGIRPTDDCLGTSLAALFGPDRGDKYEQFIRTAHALPPDEQDQIAEFVLDYTTGRQARRQYSD